MSSNHRLTRSFRTLSAIVYLLNIIVAIQCLVLRDLPQYLFEKVEITFATILVLLCLVMLMVTTNTPSLLTKALQRNPSTRSMFTFRRRYLVDIVISIILFQMGYKGIIMAIVTMLLILSIRFLGVRYSEAFNELFLPPELDLIQDDTIGGDYTRHEDVNA
mmetsp:Transcript_1536/g.1961  ORF Transcript_1536/g.1961 Transcript_1536/m.1961 type:complete len:161 (-) Transcript_1536:231-713(-)